MDIKIIVNLLILLKYLALTKVFGIFDRTRRIY